MEIWVWILPKTRTFDRRPTFMNWVTAIEVIEVLWGVHVPRSSNCGKWMPNLHTCNTHWYRKMCTTQILLEYNFLLECMLPKKVLNLLWGEHTYVSKLTRQFFHHLRARIQVLRIHRRL